jgi:GNAT superfamily N-acetyltransferase
MPLSFDLRPAAKSDIDFCWPLYRDTLKPLMAAPTDWREADQHRIVERALADTGASILCSQGTDAGWLHVEEDRQVISVKQLVIAPALRNHGLGTSFLTWMKERADRKRKDLIVEVMADSPARGFLERLDFKAIPGSSRTVTMRY